MWTRLDFKNSLDASRISCSPCCIGCRSPTKKTPSSCQAKVTANRDGQNMFATMSYLHRISDNIKTVGARAIISIVFTASNKHAKLWKGCNPDTHLAAIGITGHIMGSVKKASFIRSWDKRYVGQMGQCIKERLKEDWNIKKGSDDWLAEHWSMCGCFPLFDESFIVRMHSDEATTLKLSRQLLTILAEIALVCLHYL